MEGQQEAVSSHRDTTGGHQDTVLLALQDQGGHSREVGGRQRSYHLDVKRVSDILAALGKPHKKKTYRTRHLLENTPYLI